LATALAKTAEWYSAFYMGEDMLKLSLEQITSFTSPIENV
jgi:hypothetical protein